jgi:hypothetical protein
VTARSYCCCHTWIWVCNVLFWERWLEWGCLARQVVFQGQKAKANKWTNEHFLCFILSIIMKTSSVDTYFPKSVPGISEIEAFSFLQILLWMFREAKSLWCGLWPCHLWVASCQGESVFVTSEKLAVVWFACNGWNTSPDSQLPYRCILLLEWYLVID